ncbi:hypothetical protein [Fulvivirga ligni]|uniref:hypothetical protein n=1 Tax=Fulvivirga ligni TaxID=2904246 RepID=UPI001F17EB8A|nr:hypothetical protein [Fulvivirga ligni]UII19124.1 hypothetical protein LVD16_14865 [Fulvivirga ligni]
MKNLSINLRIFSYWSCLMAIGFIVFLSSCEESEDGQKLGDALQEVTYQSDDYSVTVRLDPNLVHNSHSFKSLQEHDDYLIDLEKSSNGLITLNKKMYEDLSHYFDPYQIAVIDNNYQLEVAGEVFKVDEEAVYKQVNGAWELDLFYGKSGLVDLEETAMVYSNVEDLEALTDYQFKSPESKRVYENKKAEISSGKVARDYGYYYYKNSNGSLRNVEYKKTPNGNTYYAYIRWYCWNESYRRMFAAKAKGGTETQILRAEDGGDFVKLNNDETIGKYLVSGQLDTGGGNVMVEIDGRTGRIAGASARWNAMRDNVKRVKDRFTHSIHYAAVRDNSTGTLIRAMYRYELN